MSEKDFAIGPVGLPQVGQVSNKPRYLVQLSPAATAKNKPLVSFISLDKPSFETVFISVKGFYCDKNEDEIVSSFAELVASAPKETIQDLLIPVHRVHCIRSLIFNANKLSTLPK